MADDKLLKAIQYGASGLEDCLEELVGNVEVVAGETGADEDEVRCTVDYLEGDANELLRQAEALSKDARRYADDWHRENDDD